MGMYDTFETDPNMEQEGVFLDYGDFRVRIAHAGQGNSKYVKYAEKKLKPVRKAMEAGALGNERSMAIMIDIYSESIILDWQVRDGDEWKSGIEARDGSVMKFTKENVENTLRALPNLFLDIQQQAQSIANFRRADLESEAGN